MQGIANLRKALSPRLEQAGRLGLNGNMCIVPANHSNASSSGMPFFDAKCSCNCTSSAGISPGISPCSANESDK